jgi:hypothetical protein
LVGYDLGIRDARVLTDIYEASALGSLHASVLDAVVDGRGHPDIAPTSAAYLAQLLFAFYLDAVVRITPDRALPSSFVIVATNVYTTLYEEETLHRDRPLPYADQKVLTNKCGEAKNLMAAVLTRVDRADLMPTVQKVVDRASLALCLMDDLMDWQEDLIEGRYTYPIQAALDQAGYGRCPVEDPAQLLPVVRRELFGTPIVHAMLWAITNSAHP